MKKIVFFILMTLMPITAQADCAGGSCNNVTIKMLYITSGVTLVGTSGTETGLTNCVPGDGTYVSLSHGQSSADQIYSALLTAYTTKMNVRIRLADTPDNLGQCYIAYVVLENN